VQGQVLEPNFLLVAALVVFAFLAHAVQWKTVSEVNSRLPQDQQFPHWWWTVSKQKRLWREHKRLCPQSPSRLYWVLSYAIAVIFMFLVVLSVHI